MKKFFINNSAEALIPLKEKHKGLLNLHVLLGLGWWVWVWGGEKWDYLQKKVILFFETEK